MAACAAPAPLGGEQHEYPIAGVTVKFPCKPYRTQIAMMAKVLNSHLCPSPFCGAGSVPQSVDHSSSDERGERSAGESDWQWEELGPALLSTGLAKE